MSNRKHDYEDAFAQGLAEILNRPENADRKAQLLANPAISEAMLSVLQQQDPGAAMRVGKLMSQVTDKPS